MLPFNKDKHRLEEGNILEILEYDIKRKMKTKKITQEKIQRLIDQWIVRNNFKVINREKLVQKVYNDLKN